MPTPHLDPRLPVPWLPFDVPGDVPIHGAIAGVRDPSVPPLIAIPGFTVEGHTYNALVRHLRHPGGLVVVDLRGRGRSGKPARRRDYGITTHARDIHRVMEYLGIERTGLIGHSFGAAVASMTAMMFPGNVSSVTLIDGGMPSGVMPLNPIRKTKDLMSGLVSHIPGLDRPYPSLERYAAVMLRRDVDLSRLDVDTLDVLRHNVEACPSPAMPDGVRCSCRRVAAEADSLSVLRTTPPWFVYRARVKAPVAIVLASEGFEKGSPALIDPLLRWNMQWAYHPEPGMDVRVPDKNHIELLLDPEGAASAAAVIDRMARKTRGAMEWSSRGPRPGRTPTHGGPAPLS